MLCANGRRNSTLGLCIVVAALSRPSLPALFSEAVSIQAYVAIYGCLWLGSPFSSEWQLVETKKEEEVLFLSLVREGGETSILPFPEIQTLAAVAGGSFTGRLWWNRGRLEHKCREKGPSSVVKRGLLMEKDSFCVSDFFCAGRAFLHWRPNAS